MSKVDAQIQTDGKNYELLLADSAKVVFGDENSLSFRPCARYSAFGEDGSGLIFRTPTTKNISPVLDKGVIGWDDPDNNLSVRFYEHADKGRWERGAIEHEVILHAVPVSPEIPFAIELSNLELFYQAPLTPEEIKAGNFRPEEMQGGYCAYHTTKGGLCHRTEADNYKAGKAFDIPRPTAKDANGDWIWGAWKESPGLLHAVFDTDWLLSAAYPVIIGPTFGYTSAGASNYEQGTGYLDGTPYALSEAGTLGDLYIYGHDGQSGGHVQVGVYSSAATRVKQDVSGAIAAGFGSGNVGWIHGASLASASLTAATYYLVYQLEKDFFSYYDAGATGEYKGSQTYGTWPGTYTKDGDLADHKFSIYAEYTAAGGSTTKTLAALGVG